MNHLLPDCSGATEEQLEYLRSIKPMIATPIRGGTVMGNYHLSVQSVSKWAALMGVNLQIQMLFGCSYIEQGRNVLTNTFYNSDCTHLIFIDADNGFITNNFFELLLCQKDIVGGVYTKRKINWTSVHKAATSGVPADMLEHCSGEFPFHPLEGHDIRIEPTPQKVLALPTGFMCISRKTLDTYVQAHPTRKTTPGNPGSYGIQFFKAGTITCDDGTKGFDSEDNIFCKDMLKLGIHTYLCPWMEISHYGEHEFKACFSCSQGAYVHVPEWLAKHTHQTHTNGSGEEIHVQ